MSPRVNAIDFDTALSDIFEFERQNIRDEEGLESSEGIEIASNIASEIEESLRDLFSGRSLVSQGEFEGMKMQILSAVKHSGVHPNHSKYPLSE